MIFTLFRLSKQRTSLLVLSVLAVLMTGCASGPLYSDVKRAGKLQPKPGKGLVLAYFEPGMTGYALRCNLFANG